MHEKPLLIEGRLNDLADVLRIARVEGKKALQLREGEEVTVRPFVYPVDNGYLVLVEPKNNGSGCSKVLGVGEVKQTEKT